MSSAPSSQSSDSSTGDLAKSLQTVRTVLFNKTTVTIFCAGLAIYLLYSLGKSIFSPRDGGYDGTNLLTYSRAIDVVAMIIILGWMYSIYVGLSDDNKKNFIGWFLRWTQDFWNNPNTLLEVTLFTIIFFACVYLFRVPMAPEIKPVVVHILETKIWIVFAMFIIIFFFKYVLGIPIIDLIYNNSIVNYFENLPSLNLTSSPSSSPAAKKSHGSPESSSSSPGDHKSGKDHHDKSSKDHHDKSSKDHHKSSSGGGGGDHDKSSGGKSSGKDNSAKNKKLHPQKNNKHASDTKTSEDKNKPKKEVFNISNYVYTYDHAKEVCHAFGADLATYDQIEKSYNKDGEWCSYGWSEGQLVLMPTQKSTWDKLQLTKDQKNMCGRPGVNGGFLGNTDMRFGANCYGVKPSRPDEFTYDDAINNFEFDMDYKEKEEEASEDDMWRATAKLTAFNNLKHEWSQY